MKKKPTPELEAEALAFVQRYAKAYGLDPNKLWRDHHQKLLKQGLDWFVRTREYQERLAADYQASRTPGRNSPPAIQWPGVETPPAPAPPYQSFAEYLEGTTHAERMDKCRAAAKKANRERLLSPRPEHRLSGDDLWGVMLAARGRCVYCGSLAVENRPSKPNGAPLPWAQIGRRIGSFDHCEWRVRGGDNDLSNIAWACLWCNTWENERRKGATDHGGFHPPPDDPAEIDTLVRSNLLAREQRVMTDEMGLTRYILIDIENGGLITHDVRARSVLDAGIAADKQANGAYEGDLYLSDFDDANEVYRVYRATDDFTSARDANAVEKECDFGGVIARIDDPYDESDEPYHDH